MYSNPHLTRPPHLQLENCLIRRLASLVEDIELEIKDTTDTDRSASYLDLHLEIDSEGRLRTKLYNKRDDFNFLIVNFPLNLLKQGFLVVKLKS